MKKLNGNLVRKINIAVFISGKGSNLLSIIKKSLTKESLFKVSLVLSNKKNVKGLLIAKKYNIKTLVSDFTKSNSKERKVIDILKKNQIKLVCLAGFMKILSNNFITLFKGKIINIHPSLLPKYKGLNTHEKVIKNKDTYTGCTVHFVTKKLDSGKIILKKKIRVKKNDNKISIQKRVLKIEHETYPKAIVKVLSNF